MDVDASHNHQENADKHVYLIFRHLIGPLAALVRLCPQNASTSSLLRSERLNWAETKVAKPCHSWLIRAADIPLKPAKPG